MHAVLNGAGGPPEVHFSIVRLWLFAAEQGIDLHALRVESKANVSDGPTREDLSVVMALGAQFAEP